MGHRVPSPRELAAHTQSIIQKALLNKKKLEEQRENFRKRQEHQQQQRATTPVNSPAKQTHSPTPLAFTPTSVLRKMTAEKEPEGAILTCAQIEQAQKNKISPYIAKVQQRLNGVGSGVVTKLLRSPDNNSNDACCTTSVDKSPPLKSKHMNADQISKSSVVIEEIIVQSPSEKLQIVEIVLDSKEIETKSDANNNDQKIVDDPSKSGKENSDTVVDAIMVGGKENHLDFGKENVSEAN